MDKKTFHEAFWFIIGLLGSVFLFFYLRQAKQGILPSVIPVFCTIIQLVALEKTHQHPPYYPTKSGSFVLLNLLFFLLFVAVFHYLSSQFVVIKVGTFIIMSMVGIYSSYFLYQFHQSARKGLSQDELRRAIKK